MSYYYLPLAQDESGHHKLPSVCRPIRYRRISRYRVGVIVFLLLVIGYLSGLFTHLMELNYDLYFHEYPKKFPNFRYFIESIRLSPDLSFSDSNQSSSFIINSYAKCSNLSSFSSIYPKNPITLLILVKSAVNNHQIRKIIRKTWGYEHRFSDVNIRTAFMLGQCNLNAPFTHATSTCQQNLIEEQKLYGDLIQADFIDSYYNNTLKTLASLEWTSKHCSHVPYFLLVDDDFYVSLKNVLKFLRNFMRTKIDDAESTALSFNFDGRLYAGFVFAHSRPMRHLTSKWYVSLSDYPYDYYPPYVTGGCSIMNNQTISDLYFASLYTQHFKYDDVYLGILAKRMDISLAHSPHIYYYKLDYDPQSYRQVIASHGFKDPQELLQVWLEQKTLGNA